LQSAANGFSACYDSDYNVQLLVKPSNVTFQWFDLAGASIGTGASRVLMDIKADSLFLVQPIIPVATEPYNLSGGFPPGLLTVKVVNPDGGAATLRWTGLVNNDWHNPNNWVEVKGTYETPAAWSPSACVDVIITTGSTHYPELVDSALCRDIMIQDRALLKNPHVLTYRDASVEIKLKPSERDRFIMWSAPLKDMYSGDYHYKSGANPRWGDVKMNLFQQAHPTGGVAALNTFTATFGQLGEPLPLGTAFNLKVTTTSESKDKTFTFPQAENSYTDVANPSVNYVLNPRTNKTRFITDGMPLLPSLSGGEATFQLRIVDNAGMSLVQVVNPYLAYLEFDKFHAGNSFDINNGYYIWNGDINESFTAISANSNRYVMTPPATVTSPNLISPLQSFFVVKAYNGKRDFLQMSPAWTTTSNTIYTLRATSVTKGGILRIKASQGTKSSYAVLSYDPNASPASGKEDMPVVIYDEIPLTLYSLAAPGTPLSINASNDFQSGNVDLGLRIKDIGEIKLNFSELETFGYNVSLIDKYLNRETNLQKTPEYTFTVAKTGANAIELNDRFSLRMEYTGKGVVVGSEAIEQPALQVSSDNGIIYIKSNGGLITQVRIYSLIGQLLYSDTTPSEQYAVPMVGSQMCIVSVMIKNEKKTLKVLVK
jgi:hypothetical protein